MNATSPSRVSGIAAHLLLAATLASLAACDPDYVETDPTATTNPECADCLLVDRDNPVLKGDVLLEAASVSGQAWDEEARRTTCPTGECWRFDRFELHVTTTGTAGVTSQSADLEPWPATAGTYDPGAAESGIVNLPWEAHGALVGYEDLRVEAYKTDAVYVRTDADLDTRVRLSEGVILVPVQVVQALPEDGSVTSTWMDRPGAEFLFDDRWKPATSRSSSGGTFTALNGQWVEQLTEPYYPPTQPDDIFAQCGIQFRMVRHVRTPIKMLYWDMTSGFPEAICLQSSGSIDNGWQASMLASAYLQDIRNLAKAVDPDFDALLPFVVYTARLQHAACAEVAESTGAFTVGSGVYLDLYPGEPKADRYLAHELGHVLLPAGTDHLAGGGPECTAGGDQNDLMCSGRLGSSLGLQISQRAEMRKRAAVYSNWYFGTDLPTE